MVTIREGGDPQTVPLAYYDEYGERQIIGEAAIQIKNGEIIALGKVKWGRGDVFASGMNLESFSISSPEPNPAEEASRRLGPLRKGSRQHVTDSNPNGEVRQCDRRDLHDSHEYQAEFGAYFNVYCPGNTGSQR